MPVFQVKASKIQEYVILIDAKNYSEARRIAKRQLVHNSEFYNPVRKITDVIEVKAYDK